MMPFKSTSFCQKKTLNVNGYLMDLSTPLVMAILNLTPDSFYLPNGLKLVDKDGLQEKLLLERVEQMLQEGASVLDLGGMSSRPGAEVISEEEELNRLIPAIKLIKQHFPKVLLSIDTWRTEVARRSLDLGANFINDITGGRESQIWEVCAQFHAPYILMHMQGMPSNMQDKPVYQNIIAEITGFFRDKIMAIQNCGVNDIILDPGFGFGKTVAHNYEILNGLSDFNLLEMPLLVGISRKSMIWKVLDCDPEETLAATSALHLQLLKNGASILRVHDVKPAMDMIKIFQASKFIW